VTYKPIPTKTEGARSSVVSEDEKAIDVLKDIRDEMRLANKYLASIIGEEITHSDLGDI